MLRGAREFELCGATLRVSLEDAGAFRDEVFARAVDELARELGARFEMQVSRAGFESSDASRPAHIRLKRCTLSTPHPESYRLVMQGTVATVVGHRPAFTRTRTGGVLRMCRATFWCF